MNGTANIGDIWDGTYFMPPAKPGATLEQAKTECRNRILAIASETAQSNINGYINLLNAKVIGGGTLTEGEQTDIATFGLAMAWINDMRTTYPTLEGDIDYQLDSKWPVCSQTLIDFANRF